MNEPRPRGVRPVVAVVLAAAVALGVVAALAACSTGPQPSTAPAAPPTDGPSATATATGVDPLEAFGTAAPLAAAPQREQDAEVALPTTVRIPSIGVESGLDDLGTAADGTVEVPEDYDRAGWFTGGPRPGQRGPAVILGHVDSRSGPAVFVDVDQLRAGDLIEVDRADGSTVEFAVDRLEQVPKDEFPSAAVYGPVPDAGLRLITCGGDFDHGTGHYRDNVVVYATAVS